VSLSANAITILLTFGKNASAFGYISHLFNKIMSKENKFQKLKRKKLKKMQKSIDKRLFLIYNEHMNICSNVKMTGGEKY